MIRRPPRSTLFPYTTALPISDRMEAVIEDAYILITDKKISAITDILPVLEKLVQVRDRKSTRLNSSHPSISYAVFCLKKKKRSDESSGHDYVGGVGEIEVATG